MIHEVRTTWSNALTTGPLLGRAVAGLLILVPILATVYFVYLVARLP